MTAASAMDRWRIGRSAELLERDRLALVGRVVALRSAGLLPPVWISDFQVSMRQDMGHFAELVPVTWAELERMVVAAELGQRMPAARELSAGSPRSLDREAIRA